MSAPPRSPEQRPPPMLVSWRVRAWSLAHPLIYKREMSRAASPVQIQQNAAQPNPTALATQAPLRQHGPAACPDLLHASRPVRALTIRRRTFDLGLDTEVSSL